MAGGAVVLWLLLVGISSSISRLGVLVGALAAHDREGFAASYAQHPLTMFLHIAPGVVVMLLGPLQFAEGIRSSRPHVHRWLGRTYLALGLLVAVSSLSIVLRFPFGGTSEATAIAFFTTVFAFSLLRAFLHIRRRQVERHREWMIRAFSIVLGISVVRISVWLLATFIEAPLAELLGIASWLGFGATLLSAEVWIAVSRRGRAA